MAKVWFVGRSGAQWIAAGGKPAYEIPLEQLVFPLDLGPQRWLTDDHPVLRPDLPPADPATPAKVLVETRDEDVAGTTLTWFRVGFYESPYSPTEAARRLKAAQTPA